MVLGLLYAAVSVYWGLGGTSLVDTVGGSLEKGGRAGDAAVVLALWAAVVLKLIGAVLPLVVVHRSGGARWQRVLLPLTWVEAAVLVGYGLVLTVVGLLVQLGVISTPASADHHALAWHTYLWDPWFLLWGLLVTGALLRSRRRTRTTTPAVAGTRTTVAVPAVPSPRGH